MSFAVVDDVCAVGCELLRDGLRAVKQCMARARATSGGYAIDLGACDG
jgi:hypothetical protein